MSVPNAGAAAPNISGEATLQDDLERWRIQMTAETDPSNTDGNDNLGDLGGAIELGTLLDLERHEVVELVSLEDIETAIRVEPIPSAGSSPGSARVDHSLWIRPSQTSGNPFIFDDPATQLADESVDTDGDGNDEWSFTISAVEANTVYEGVATYEKSFADATNGPGGSSGGTYEYDPMKNFRKEYDRGRLMLPGDELGMSGFIDVDNVGGVGSFWFKFQATLNFDRMQLEDEPVSIEDILTGTTQ